MVTVVAAAVPAELAPTTDGATMNVARTAATRPLTTPRGMDALWAPLFKTIKTLASCLPERRASARRRSDVPAAGGSGRAMVRRERAQSGRNVGSGRSDRLGEPEVRDRRGLSVRRDAVVEPSVRKPLPRSIPYRRTQMHPPD